MARFPKARDRGRPYKLPTWGWQDPNTARRQHRAAIGASRRDERPNEALSDGGLLLMCLALVLIALLVVAVG